MAFRSFWKRKAFKLKAPASKSAQNHHKLKKKTNNFELAPHPRHPGAQRSLQAMDLNFLQEASAEFWIVFWENARNNSRKKRRKHTSLCKLQVLCSSDPCGCNFHDLHQRDCKDKFKQKHQTSGGFSMGSSSLLNSKLHKFFPTGMTVVKQTLQTWTEPSGTARTPSDSQFHCSFRGKAWA